MVASLGRWKNPPRKMSPGAAVKSLSSTFQRFYFKSSYVVIPCLMTCIVRHRQQRLYRDVARCPREGNLATSGCPATRQSCVREVKATPVEFVACKCLDPAGRYSGVRFDTAPAYTSLNWLFRQGFASIFFLSSPSPVSSGVAFVHFYFFWLTT